MDAMNEQDNKVIKKKYVRLRETLEAQNLTGYLYQEGVFTDNDKEKISASSTSEEKAEKLLDILRKRKDGLKMLIKALLVSGVQGFLGNELLEMVEWNEEEMKNFQLELEGKIDPQQKLEATIAALKQENNQLKAKNDESQGTIKELNDRLHEKDEKIDHLTQELDEKNAENNLLKAREKLREENGRHSPRQTKLSRTNAFHYTCNGKHRRSQSESR